MNILQAFKEARDFVNMHSEPWYLSGQALLKKLDAAIEEMEKAEPVAQINSFGCQPLCQFDVHEWGTPLYLHPAPIPEGWQLVPKEPTKEMLHAFWISYCPGPRLIQNIWKAMLDAAPKPEELKYEIRDKPKKIKLLAWVEANGNLNWRKEGYEYGPYWARIWKRAPSEDKEIEVEE